MKKLISIFVITLIVSCNKENSCKCYRSFNDTLGTSKTYSYTVKSKTSKHKLKTGACQSYSQTEVSGTTIYKCEMN